ncbi:MAG: diadenylate cyclase [Planctomycetota bacterium]
MNKLTQSMIQHARAIAVDIGAKSLMFDAEAFDSSEELQKLLVELDHHVVLINRGGVPLDIPLSSTVSRIVIPKVPLTRLGQIKIAVLLGVAEKLFERNDWIVCLSGSQVSDRLDMMAVVKVGDEPEVFLTNETSPLPPDVQPAVFQRVLAIVSELAVEGREHRPVGALFVVGDSDNVLENSRQLIFNPFHGYPEDERNILSGALEETIKEFAAIDGAFVIRGDGVVLSAGRYLMAKGKPAEPLRSGLGARHEAAAAITAVTDAVAITLSESTSTITIFNSGRMMTEIEKIKSGGPDL